MSNALPVGAAQDGMGVGATKAKGGEADLRREID